MSKKSLRCILLSIRSNRKASRRDHDMRFLYLFIFSLLTANSHATIYDVSTTSELRAALVSAGETGGENTIRLAAGTYSTQDDGGGTFLYVSMKSSVLNLFGAGRLETIISGQETDQIFRSVIEDSSSFTANFSEMTLQFGLAIGTGLALEKAGGAIDLDQGAASITNMILKSNIAFGSGGAINSAGFLTVTNSIFTGNESINGRGGAINAKTGWDIIDSHFTDNRAEIGGAVAGSGIGSTKTENNYFLNNTADQGGAIYPYACNGTHLTMGNTFEGNSASSYQGAGKFCRNTVANLFMNNSAGSQGVGWASGNFTSNILRDNHTTAVAPIDNQPIADLHMTGNSKVSNNIFSNTSLALSKDIVLSNNIFMDNEVDLFTLSGENFYPINNNFLDIGRLDSQILVNGAGNIHDGINLGFANAEEGDYRLTSSSGLIDIGTTDPALAFITDYDYTGTTARIIGSSVDIGPYEYDGEEPPDRDSDGLNDNIDNCPLIANADQADNDSDGEGDICDLDDDNDGTADTDDAFPLNASESLDTDGDGVGNNEDYDDDGDGFLDASDPQPIIANVFAIDSDGDGVADSLDDYPTDVSRQFANDGDIDGDGYTNDEEVDYCSNPLDATSQPRVQGLSPALIKSAIDASSDG
jgi:hypothetical protein